MVAALRTRAVRDLTALYAAAFVLEWFSTVALMVLVYNATNSALVATAMLLSRQLAPVFLVPTLSDKLDTVAPRTALAATLLAQAGIVLLFATFGYGSWLFPLAAAAGTCGVLFRSALRGTMSRSLDGPMLRQANAAMNVLVAVAAAAGPALAAWAVAGLGPAGALWIGAAGTGLLALLALRLPRLIGASASAGAGAQHDDARDRPSAAGRSVLPYSLLLAFAGVVVCVCAMDEPGLLAFSQDALGAGVGGYGAIYVAWGLGAMLGSLVFARVLDRSMLVVAAGSGVAIGLAYLGMGLSSGITLACAFAVLGGAGNGIGFVALVTAVQEAAARGDEVRAAARLETVSTAAPAIGIVLGGLLTEFAGPRFSLVVPGVVCLAVIALAIFVARLGSARTAFSATVRLSPTTPGGTV